MVFYPLTIFQSKKENLEMSRSYPPRMLFSFMIVVKVALALFGTNSMHYSRT